MEREDKDLEKVFERIDRVLLVLSGKGGVGKSTVAANLAVSLSLAGNRVGLMDIDLHGPSIPGILNLQDHPLNTTGETLIPVNYADKLQVISVGFMLGSRDAAVIWRGPLKHNVIRQFFTEVQWNPLDFLVVDSPPGTGDEPLSIVQLVKQARRKTDLKCGAVVVTTPQELSLNDVRKCITFCRQLELPVLGVVENMSGFVCPHCGKRTDIFKTGGGVKLAEEMNVNYLGSIPLDPRIVDAGDKGDPYIKAFKESDASIAFEKIVRELTK